MTTPPTPVWRRICTIPAPEPLHDLDFVTPTTIEMRVESDDPLDQVFRIDRGSFGLGFTADEFVALREAVISADIVLDMTAAIEKIFVHGGDV